MIDPYHVNQGDVIRNLKSKDWSDNLINKYLKYINCKSRVIKTGRTAFTDSGKSKTYKAEWKFQSKFKYDIVDFDNAKEAQKYMKRITSSKLWLELCGGQDCKVPTLNVRPFRGRTAGRAWRGHIDLCAMNGMDAYTLLHEMAHVAGHMHHDVSFRQCIVRLTSRFIGASAAKFLKKCFKEQGLKMSISHKVQQPEDWLVGYQRLAMAREKIAA